MNLHIAEHACDISALNHRSFRKGGVGGWHKQNLSERLFSFKDPILYYAQHDGKQNIQNEIAEGSTNQTTLYEDFMD